MCVINLMPITCFWYQNSVYTKNKTRCSKRKKKNPSCTEKIRCINFQFKLFQMANNLSERFFYHLVAIANVCAPPNDKFIRQLFGYKMFGEWIGEKKNRISSENSVRQLKALNKRFIVHLKCAERVVFVACVMFAINKWDTK